MLRDFNDSTEARKEENNIKGNKKGKLPGHTRRLNEELRFLRKLQKYYRDKMNYGNPPSGCTIND